MSGQKEICMQSNELIYIFFLKSTSFLGRLGKNSGTRGYFSYFGRDRVDSGNRFFGSGFGYPITRAAPTSKTFKNDLIML